MQTALKKGLSKPPHRIAMLPRDERGFPIPWFVNIDAQGVPDFRVLRPGAIVTAYNRKKCWICGGQMHTKLAFVIGPMCAINRINSEPPSHRECAHWAAVACPFLSNPRMKRDTKNELPPDKLDVPGIHLDRNPGACCVWVTKSYKPFFAGNGYLFELGDPIAVYWYAEGRRATRAEVLASIQGGMPLLERMAAQDGVESTADLHRQYVKLQELLPAAEAA